MDIVSTKDGGWSCVTLKGYQKKKQINDVIPVTLLDQTEGHAYTSLCSQQNLLEYKKNKTSPVKQ
jgi:hypothetical protein